MNGQAKIDFEIWYSVKFFNGEFKLTIEDFNMLNSSFKWGVYLDWFESIGMFFNVSPSGFVKRIYTVSFMELFKKDYMLPHVNNQTDRRIAQDLAIKAAVAYYNDNIFSYGGKTVADPPKK